MINVGTGNLLLQDDDMNVPHRGIALAFRRTYNSQSLPSITGQFTTWQSLYGNGWTSTFDAHVVQTSYSTISVYDIDGARYDYSTTPGYEQVVGYTSLTPGQHAIFAFDGACGFTWTKKSGTTYYFYSANPQAPCPGVGTIGGYAGRLHQIIGRNRNTYLTFNYAWDGGVASANGKISAISIQAESGMTATLSFGDVAGRRLLQQILFPDGRTSVSYGYDSAGNLTSVSKPPNNAAGIRPQQTFGYQALGADSVLWYTYSPRLNASTPFGSDGGWTGFLFAGTDHASATVTETVRRAVVNPAIADGSSQPVLQPGYPSTPYYLYEYFTTGGTTPTLRDTDGHALNWVVDSSGRPTQTQECTATANQQCVGTWLVTNESWDSSNNVTARVDSRGEIDYAYDANGNTIAVALPPVATTPQGVLRPTTLISYDSYNNVSAFCDQDATAVLGMSWTSPPAQSDQLCPSSSVATRVAYNYTAAAPYGEVATLTGPATPSSPGGYSRTFSYPASAADYGLPIGIVGDAVTQPGPTAQSSDTFQPTQTFTYDQQGNVICYGNGVGTWLLQYDSLNRKVVESDPDDSSVAGCGKPTSGKATAAYFTYFPSGDIAYEESAIQYSADVAAGNQGAAHSFTYDLDGNAITETHHHGCNTIFGCVAGVTNKWYDGADRLVEVSQPRDPKFDLHPYRWMVRYIYDLTGGGSVSLTAPSFTGASASATAPFRAYGNLYDTQTYVDVRSANDSTPTWVDHLGTSYDALDRKTASFDVALGTAAVTSTVYDATPTTLGLESSMTRATGEKTSKDYDAAGRLVKEAFSGDGGGTPSRTYAMTAAGRVSTTTSSLGTESYSYDALGRVLSHTEPSSVGGNTVSYGWTGSGLRTSLTVGGGINTQLFQYNYRHDGKLANQYVNGNSGWQQFSWTYTPSGRLLQRKDPTTGIAVARPPPPPPAANLSVRNGFSNTFQPLTYTLDAHDSITAVAYSNGYAVNGITTDLEGGQSGEFDSFAYNSATNQSTGSHHSTGITFTTRDELAAVGPNLTGTSYPYRDFSVWQQSNGIKVASSFDSNGSVLQAYGPYESGSDFTTPLNQLDGHEMSSSGYTQKGGNYTNTVVYDAAGRLKSNHAQECMTDSSANSYLSESLVQNTYDAENHSLGSVNSIANGPGCTFGGPWSSQWTWAQSWSTNGHPYKSAYTSQTYGTQASRYLHWDGDILLFTSQTASGPADDIKIGSIGDLTPADGNITVLDRDTAGDVMDGHGVQAQVYDGLVSSTAYNDSGMGGGLLKSYVTEPRPDQLTGPFGLTIQGARAVDSTSSHWTTPDAFAGIPADPASQMPFMYERNNSYKYSDPSGYCAEDACIVEGGVVITLGIAEVAELAGDAALASSIRGGVSAVVRQGAMAFQRAGGWVEGRLTTAAGKLRIPDHLNWELKEIGEAKDVAYQHLSSQLKDYIAFADKHGLTFILRIRGGANPTKLSGPLRKTLEELIAKGRGRIEWIGGRAEDLHP